ncbi:MAG: OmpA family protein [Castellaniella sp.]
MNSKMILGAVVSALVLAGCGSLSKVDGQGHTDQPVFPDITNVNFDAGSFPNVDNLRVIRPGMTRDQLYNLIGRPHFSEGFKVREWDYLFHFDMAQGALSCQYKILFDKQRIAQSFHWQPAECADVLNPAPAAKSFSLSGDVGFAFGSAVLSAAGAQEVVRIAQALAPVRDVQSITVSGHTDRIGNAQANQRLSEQRAAAVRQALIGHGLPAARIQAQGYGATRPVVQCDQTVRAELIACLAPNRRVDIAVQARQ